ncbi:MAG: hypothetical protein KGZ85_10460 [Ignavibacterium sp.]|nr:hypothetical protein [Ignavibacterium sp.]MBS4034879.1 hypothetical protein [Ignavibacterium sp.]
MGEIVYWTIIRTAVVLPLLWLTRDYIDEKYWWIFSLLCITLFIIYPAYFSYRKFVEKNQNVISETLCASCKHFDQSAVLCMKYDKHPTENYIPCEGTDWEPK